MIIAQITDLHVRPRGWKANRVFDGSVRFMCSWATTPEAVDELAEALKAVQ